MRSLLLLILVVFMPAVALAQTSVRAGGGGGGAGGTTNGSGVTYPTDITDSFCVGDDVDSASSCTFHVDPSTGVVSINGPGTDGGGLEIKPWPAAAGNNVLFLDPNSAVPTAPAVGQVGIFALSSDDGGYHQAWLYDYNGGPFPLMAGPACDSVVIPVAADGVWDGDTLYPMRFPTGGGTTDRLPGGSNQALDDGFLEVVSISCHTTPAAGTGTLEFDARLCSTSACVGLPGARVISDQTCTATPASLTLSASVSASGAYPYLRLDELTETNQVDALWLTVCYLR